jgi:signal transduction histidine kinase
MTLRTRLTLLVAVLLAAVLLVVGIVLVDLDDRDVQRRIRERALERVRAPFPAPTDAGEAIEVRPLPAEPDGARLEVFAFEIPAPGEPPSEAGPAMRARAATPGAPVLERRDAESWLPGPGPVGHGSVWAMPRLEGREWQVVVETLPPQPEGPRGRRGPPGPGEPPPRAPRRGPPRPTVVVAFLETGPAREAHDAFALRTVLTCLAALAGGVLAAWLLAGRALRPVGDLAAAAERVRGVGERLPASGARDEVARLAAVLNGMLGRLEAASERERAFLATASHELRRPLSALLGELELARAPGRDAVALRESVRLAQEDARGMARLVDDVLHLARARAGTLRLERGPVALRDVVADAVERSRRALGGALSARIGDVPAVVVEADADALRRVVENLVVNAATHGGADVTVHVEGRADADGVVLVVEDDGSGIPPEDVPRLFDPFGRGDRARGVPGFGLGLAIVRELVAAHGGRVEATSPVRDDPQRPGARFTVHLPPPPPGAHGEGPT